MFKKHLIHFLFSRNVTQKNTHMYKDQFIKEI